MQNILDDPRDALAKDFADHADRQKAYELACPWDSLTGSDWADLLSTQPKYQNKFNTTAQNKLSGADWSKLLSAEPQFNTMCTWSKLEGKDWVQLLIKYPAFDSVFDSSATAKLTGKDWVLLLMNKPQFGNKCIWSKLASSDWGALLPVKPEFSIKLDRSVQATLQGTDWVSLLK